MEVALALGHGSSYVEASLAPRPRQRDVAPFLKARAAIAEHKRSVHGNALACVAGQRIGVPDLTGFEVLALELDSVAAVREHAQRPSRNVDSFDGAASPVPDAEEVGVVQADDPVAGCESDSADHETFAAEPAVAFH